MRFVILSLSFTEISQFWYSTEGYLGTKIATRHFNLGP